MAGELPRDQVAAVMEVLQGAIGGDAILGAYLYGSGVAGGLRPDSDLDLFVVADRRMTADEARRLVDGLLPISGRATRPSGWRPVELTIVDQHDVRPWRYPPRFDFQYGEWLRDAFLAGDLAPWPEANPDLAILVTMVRETGVAEVGPPAADLLDPVPRDDLVRAMLDEIPSLLADLEDDTRNVLLTLARMWTTMATGEIRSKDAAAAWAVERLPAEERPILDRARTLYLEGGYGPWGDADGVRSLASRLVGEIQRIAGLPDARR